MSYVIRRTGNHNGIYCVGFLARAKRSCCRYAPLGDAKMFRTREAAQRTIEKYCKSKIDTYEILEVK